MARRSALGVLGAGALGAVLWPRVPRAERGIPRGRTVIQYWEKWTGPEGDAIQRVVDLYNASQDRDWVRRVPVSDIAGKAMVAIAGGDPPDVVGLYSYHVPLLAETGAAMAMDEFASRPGGGGEIAEIHGGLYAPAVARLLSFGERQWCGVNTCYTLALYYNRSLFRRAGLDPDRPPATVSELDAATESLTERSPAGLERAGFLPNMPGWWPYFWPVMFGGKLFDASSGRVLIADEPCVRAYGWVGRCAARVGAGAGSRFAGTYARSYHSAGDPFIAGRVGMIVQGPWLANFIRLYNPGLDFGAAAVPTEAGRDPERPAGMLEADVLVIPRGCPHPKEAYRFLAFTQRAQVQEMLARAHGKSSPMAVVSPGFAADHPNPYVGVHDAIVRSPCVRILPQTRAWQSYADQMIGAFDEIWNGASVRGVLGRVAARVQSQVDREAGRARARRARGSAS